MSTVKDQIKALILSTDMKQFSGDRDALFLFIQEHVANADENTIVEAIGEAADEKRREGEGYKAEADALDGLVALRERGALIAEIALEETPLPWDGANLAKHAKALAIGSRSFLEQSEDAYDIALTAILTGFFTRIREREDYHRRLVAAMLAAPATSVEDWAASLMPNFADATFVQFSAASAEAMAIQKTVIAKSDSEIAALEKFMPLFDGMPEGMSLGDCARAKAKDGDALADIYLEWEKRAYG